MKEYGFTGQATISGYSRSENPAVNAYMAATFVADSMGLGGMPMLDTNSVSRQNVGNDVGGNDIGR